MGQCVSGFDLGSMEKIVGGFTFTNFLLFLSFLLNAKTMIERFFFFVDIRKLL